MSAAAGGGLIPRGTIDWLQDRFTDVVWADDPRRQVAANLVLFLAAMLSSSVTLGATLVIAAIALVFGSVGIARILYRQIRG